MTTRGSDGGPQPPKTMAALRQEAETTEATETKPGEAWAASEIDPELLSPESLELMGEMAGTMMAGLYASVGAATECPDIWRLNDKQREQLDKLCAVLVRRYLPLIADHHPELWAFAVFQVVLIAEKTTRTIIERKRRAASMPQPDTKPATEPSKAASSAPNPGAQVLS